MAAASSSSSSTAAAQRALKSDTCRGRAGGRLLAHALLLDAAARLFARVFFQHIAGSRGGGGSLYTRAFEEVKRAVQLCTRDWKGRKVASPCYDVRDPDDPSTAPPPSVGSKKVPVGLPVLLLATGEIVM